MERITLTAVSKKYNLDAFHVVRAAIKHRVPMLYQRSGSTHEPFEVEHINDLQLQAALEAEDAEIGDWRWDVGSQMLLREVELSADPELGKFAPHAFLLRKAGPHEQQAIHFVNWDGFYPFAGKGRTHVDDYYFGDLAAVELMAEIEEWRAAPSVGSNGSSATSTATARLGPVVPFTEARQKASPVVDPEMGPAREERLLLLLAAAARRMAELEVAKSRPRGLSRLNGTVNAKAVAEVLSTDLGGDKGFGDGQIQNDLGRGLKLLDARKQSASVRKTSG